jgi:hypothetical protein
VLGKLFAMNDCLGIALERNTDAVSHGNAVFQVEEKFLHSRQPWFVLLASQFLFLNNTRSEAATSLCRFRSTPGGNMRA